MLGSLFECVDVTPPIPRHPRQQPAATPRATEEDIPFVMSREDHTPSQTLECDYEVDCTTLYKKIEQEEYDSVVKFLETGYWQGAIFSDPVEPVNQARTWVTRFDVTTGDIIWSQLPLHLAVVARAPVRVIKALLNQYPQAIRCTDDQRMLPLHLALRYGNTDDVVSVLLKKFPEAVNVRGGKGEGRLPVEYAVRGNNRALGEILETFLGQAQAKASKVAAKNHSRELEYIRAKLQAKEYELAVVKEKLTAIDEEKGRLSKLTGNDVNTEFQKRMDELEKRELELKQSETIVKNEEQEIREELCNSMKQVDQTPKDKDNDKKDDVNEKDKDEGEEAKDKSTTENKESNTKDKPVTENNESEDKDKPIKVQVSYAENMQDTEVVIPRSKIISKRVLNKPSAKAKEEGSKNEVDSLKSEIVRLKSKLEKQQRRRPDPMIVNGNSPLEKPKPMKSKRSLFGNRKFRSRVPSTKASI